jgi:hypothetical protein
MYFFVDIIRVSGKFRGEILRKISPCSGKYIAVKVEMLSPNNKTLTVMGLRLHFASQSVHPMTSQLSEVI